jgi:hypothetical protein
MACCVVRGIKTLLASLDLRACFSWRPGSFYVVPKLSVNQNHLLTRDENFASQSPDHATPHPNPVDHGLAPAPGLTPDVLHLCFILQYIFSHR